MPLARNPKRARSQRKAVKPERKQPQAICVTPSEIGNEVLHFTGSLKRDVRYQHDLAVTVRDFDSGKVLKVIHWKNIDLNP